MLVDIFLFLLFYFELCVNCVFRVWGKINLTFSLFV